MNHNNRNASKELIRVVCAALGQMSIFFSLSLHLSRRSKRAVLPSARVYVRVHVHVSCGNTSVPNRMAEQQLAGNF